MSDSLRPYRLKPSRLLCSWDSPGKNTGMSCHALLQGIILTQGWNLPVLCFLYWQAGSLPAALSWFPSMFIHYLLHTISDSVDNFSKTNKSHLILSCFLYLSMIFLCPKCNVSFFYAAEFLNKPKMPFKINALNYFKFEKTI